MGTTIVFHGVHDVRESVEKTSSVRDHISYGFISTLKVVELDDLNDKTGVILTTIDIDISARDPSFSFHGCHSWSSCDRGVSRSVVHVDVDSERYCTFFPL